MLSLKPVDTFGKPCKLFVNLWTLKKQIVPEVYNGFKWKKQTNLPGISSWNCFFF